jgi:hypothetical protein
MATREELLEALAVAEDDEEPFEVGLVDLGKLSATDLPVGVRIQPVERVDSRGVRHLALNGTLVRLEDDRLVVEVEEHGWRKYWDGSLGIEEYHDLVRAAVEARARGQGDVQLEMTHDEDVMYGLDFAINVPAGNLREALDHAIKVNRELLEAAEAVRVGIDDIVTTAAKRLEGWGSDPLDALVDQMRDGTAHEKGLRLEELVSRLFNQVPGFSATGRVLTETEEIDIRIQNTSDDAFWRRESALLIAECKNWSTNCGHQEFTVFKDKLRNRVGRVSTGFLVSWNGFADTVTKDMLRGSEGTILVVPIEGSDLRAAVRDGNFPDTLKALTERAVFL